MMRQLLPPNRTPLQAALADSSALNIDPTPLRHTADASRCPAALLPWLAWARSVDGWDEAMAEQPRRELVRQSFAIHKRAGTAGAMRRAMAALGVAVEFKEWQSMPGAAPYTFGLVAWVNDNPANESAVLTPQLYDRLKRLVDQTRNERSHYQFEVGARFDQAMQLANASQTAAVGRWTAEAQPVQPAPALQRLVLANASQAAAVGRWTAEAKPVQPTPARQGLAVASTCQATAVLRITMEA